jgi:hypothetical protein
MDTMLLRHTGCFWKVGGDILLVHDCVLSEVRIYPHSV